MIGKWKVAAGLEISLSMMLVNMAAMLGVVVLCDVRVCGCR